jgi:enamine deaminase RidA (YjgF/YER057c/UK114 family)
VTNEEVAAGLSPPPGYRYAERVGDQLLVAGQVPLDSTGTLVGPGDPARQATACLDNLRTLVGVHGFSIDDVRRLTIYVVGEHDHLLAAWGAASTWFGRELPPATLLGVHLLGYPDQLVEVDAVVIRSG